METNFDKYSNKRCSKKSRGSLTAPVSPNFKLSNRIKPKTEMLSTEDQIVEEMKQV